MNINNNRGIKLKESGAATLSVDEVSMGESKNKVIPPEEHIGLQAEALPNDLLTPRETQIVAALATGRVKAAIATLLFIAYGTMKTHMKNIFRKLGVNNSHAAVAMAIADGLIKVSKVDAKPTAIKNGILSFLLFFMSIVFSIPPEDGANPVSDQVAAADEYVRTRVNRGSRSNRKRDDDYLGVARSV